MAATETSLAGTYLSFTLGEEDFAVEIAKVREVLDYPPITKVPRMPEYMCGVTNIRGDVVPLIDMCQKLGMPAIQRTWPPHGLRCRPSVRFCHARACPRCIHPATATVRRRPQTGGLR